MLSKNRIKYRILDEEIKKLRDVTHVVNSPKSSQEREIQTVKIMNADRCATNKQIWGHKGVNMSDTQQNSPTPQKEGNIYNQ